jgi:hypothetical protein
MRGGGDEGGGFQEKQTCAKHEKENRWGDGFRKSKTCVKCETRPLTY